MVSPKLSCIFGCRKNEYGKSLLFTIGEVIGFLVNKSGRGGKMEVELASVGVVFELLYGFVLLVTVLALAGSFWMNRKLRTGHQPDE